MITVDFYEVLRTSFTMVVLLFCSIIALSFAMERWWYFRKIRMDVENFMAVLLKHVQAKNHKEALDLCRSVNSPLAKLMEVAVLNSQRQKAQLVELMNATRLDKRMEMERFLIVLGTMSTICPFIGLFGTVIGIIRAFHDLAVSGTGGPSVVAAGISEALVATAAGLAVAIPSVILYNYFMRKSKTISCEMESNQMRVLVHLDVN